MSKTSPSFSLPPVLFWKTLGNEPELAWRVRIVGKFVWLGKSAEVLSECLRATAVSHFSQPFLRSTCVSPHSPDRHGDTTLQRSRPLGRVQIPPSHPPDTRVCTSLVKPRQTIHLLSLSRLEKCTLCGRGNGRQLDNCLRCCAGSSFIG